MSKKEKLDKQIAKQQALDAIEAIMRTVMREELTTPIRPAVAFALDADGQTYTQLHLDEHKAVVAALHPLNMEVLRDVVRDELSSALQDVKDELVGALKHEMQTSKTAQDNGKVTPIRSKKE